MEKAKQKREHAQAWAKLTDIEPEKDDFAVMLSVKIGIDEDGGLNE